MSGKKDKERQALNRLTDALVDDILNTSDEDILAEFGESHSDPEKHAADMRALFEKTVTTMNKRRLKAAQAAIAASRRPAAPAATPQTDIAEARAKLRRLLETGTSDQRLTLAARNESELSDADVLGMLEDLEELENSQTDEEKGDSQ